MEEFIWWHGRSLCSRRSLSTRHDGISSLLQFSRLGWSQIVRMWLETRLGRGRWRFVTGGFEGALSVLVTSTAIGIEATGAEDGPGLEESCKDGEESAVLWRVLPAAAAYVREETLKVSLAFARASGKGRCSLVFMTNISFSNR